MRNKIRKYLENSIDNYNLQGINPRNRRGYYNMGTLLNKGRGLASRDYVNTVKTDVRLRQHYKLAFTSNFRYIDFPNTDIAPNLIESILYDKGLVGLLKFGDSLLVVHPIFDEAVKDKNNNYTKARVMYLDNTTSTEYFEINKDLFILKNNADALPTVNIVNDFTAYMSLNREAVWNNLKASMTRWLVEVKDGKGRNIRNEINRLFSGNGLIGYVNTGMTEQISDHPFYDKFDSKEYWEDYFNTKNELLNMLGIPTNPNQDKRERLVVDEVNVQQYQTTMFLNSYFEERYYTINKINEVLGHNIKLEVLIEPKQDESEEKESDFYD